MSEHHKCMFQSADTGGMPLAQVMGLPPPDRGDINNNCQWNTRLYGTVQLIRKMLCSLLKSIYDIGQSTTPYCHSVPVDAHIDPDLAELVKQHTNSDNKSLHIWKTHDGYLLTDANSNVFALVHSKGLHFHDAHPQKCTGEGHMMVIAHEPNSPPVKSFKAVLHNNVCSANELSRVGSIESLMRQVFSSILYAIEPRVIYSSPMGQLLAQMLNGEASITVKTCFLEIAAEEGPNMYHERLDMHANICDLLMLWSSSGNLRCVPCANSMLGYRNHALYPDKRILVLVANSKDFKKFSMDPESQTNLQLFKLNYTDCNGPMLFNLCETEDECKDDMDIPCTYTVQQVLNQLAKVWRDNVNDTSNLWLFEIGANLTRGLAESSQFIDSNAKNTQSMRTIKQFLMQCQADPNFFASDVAAAV
jgi:hypothetical protein